MKKLLLITFVLALTTAALTWGSTTQNQSSPQNIQAATTPSATQGEQLSNSPNNKRGIDDPAEYNALMAALKIPEPASRAAALEAFLVQYPNSAGKMDALEGAQDAYQQTNDLVKLQDTAKRILKLDPGNLRSLVVDIVLESRDGNVAATGEEARRGLQGLPAWPKPEKMSQEEYDQKRKQWGIIFDNAAAVAALKAKDYAGADNYYAKAIELDPSAANYVQLGAAKLQMNPPDVQGFWYLAKATTLAQSQENNDAAKIANYGKAMYHSYHGGDDGWEQIVSATPGQSAVPVNFTVKPRPTQCELIVTVAEQNDPATLSFSDWEMVLSHRDCSPEARPAADKIWKFIQDKQKRLEKAKLSKTKLKRAKPKYQNVKLLISVKVISTTGNTIQAAITDENQQAGKPDLQITLAKPLKLPPAKGSEISVAGLLTDYTPNPFMFIMQEGELRPDKAATPVKPATPAKRGASKLAKPKSAAR
ncbi:MAG TPA: hypothetical protein VK699_16210 [Terriglobales bacterium]|jgi:hypothetical protein|nr:hypothetical protein [Terriglobales bacterium]